MSPSNKLSLLDVLRHTGTSITKNLSPMQKEFLDAQNKTPVTVIKNYNDLKTKLFQEKFIKIDKQINVELKVLLDNIIGRNNYEYLYGHFGNRNFVLRKLIDKFGIYKDREKVDFISKNKDSYLIIDDFFSKKPKFTCINDLENASNILPKMIHFLDNKTMDKRMLIAFSKTNVIKYIEINKKLPSKTSPKTPVHIKNNYYPTIESKLYNGVYYLFENDEPSYIMISKNNTFIMKLYESLSIGFISEKMNEDAYGYLSELNSMNIIKIKSLPNLITVAELNM